MEVVESHLRATPSFDLADFPVPTGHEEVWRFVPMSHVAPLLDEAADWQTMVPYAAPVDEIARFAPVDRPSAIAYRQAKPQLIQVVGVEDKPTVVQVDGAGGRHAFRLRIEAEPQSHGTVVIEHKGPETFLENVEIVVGAGADLTVVSLQEWDDDALHAGLHQAVIGRDAHFRHIAVTFGGSLVRLQTNVSYDGPGGVAELFGLYLTDGHQYHEHRLFVDQNQPKTTSRVDYRGALQGKGAHSAWVGDVLIRREAEGTDSYERNRNLLLTPGCLADSVPNLEIETGNIVGAGHSSATGRFDDEQLFYLQSRGIPEDEARRLIVQGFFFDIIGRIGVPAVEQRLRDAVNAELNYQPDKD